MGKKKALPSIKVCIVGSENVGKYSLGQQFAKGWIEPKDSNDSPTAYCPSKEVELQNIKYEVKVQICKNIEEDEQFVNCDGIVLIYSVTDKASFDYISTAYKVLSGKLRGASNSRNGIHAQNGESGGQKSDSKPEETIETPTAKPSGSCGISVPVILVGNKVDDAKLARAVDFETAKSLSEELFCTGTFETAAECNADVPKAFNCLLTEIANRKPDSEKIKQTNACCVII